MVSHLEELVSQRHFHGRTLADMGGLPSLLPN